MKKPLNALRKFRGFLASVPLDRYPKETKDVKWIEQGLPKEVSPFRRMVRGILGGDKFKPTEQEGFGRFQLDFCSMFEYVCAQMGKNLPLICNAELDAKGIDAQVEGIGFQVAKISERKEARMRRTKKISGKVRCVS